VRRLAAAFLDSHISIFRDIRSLAAEELARRFAPFPLVAKRSGASQQWRTRAYNGRMDHSKLVSVQAFGSQAEADLAKSMLDSAGIDSMIQADRAGGMRDHLAWSGLGFKVLVREEDAADAREALNPPEGASATPALPSDEDAARSKPSN
jgi:putative signal transducing protein